MRDGTASGDAGPGAADLRGEAGLRPEHHESEAGPVRCDGTGAHGDVRCIQGMQTKNERTISAPLKLKIFNASEIKRNHDFMGIFLLRI